MKGTFSTIPTLQNMPIQDKEGDKKIKHKYKQTHDILLIQNKQPNKQLVPAIIGWKVYSHQYDKNIRTNVDSFKTVDTIQLFFFHI